VLSWSPLRSRSMSIGAAERGADGALDFRRRRLLSLVVEPSVLYPDSRADRGARDRDLDLCWPL
jgi:hypothetical protein